MPVNAASKAEGQISRIIQKGADNVAKNEGKLTGILAKFSVDERQQIAYAVMQKITDSGLKGTDADKMRALGKALDAFGEWVNKNRSNYGMGQDGFFGSMHHAAPMNAGNELLDRANQMQGIADRTSNV